MQLIKTITGISLAALLATLLAACGEGDSTRPSQELPATVEPSALEPTAQEDAATPPAGPSCIADFVDKPCLLLTSDLVKEHFPTLPEGVETREILSLKSCEYTWPGDRVMMIKVSNFEVEAPVTNRIAISWIGVHEPDKALERFTSTYRNLTEEEKAQTIAALQEELDKQAPDGMAGEQKELASGIGASLINASQFENVDNVGTAAAWDGNTMGNSLKVLDRDTEFSIDVNISDSEADNRELAVQIANGVMDSCW